LISLATPVTTEATIRQSRFVTHAGPVDSEEQTLEFFKASADPAATHNCWAWKLEHSYRFNDDGEPGGTAGKPILAAIEGKQLCCVMVVVSRYFGGIKLGAGGLVRAYSGCAARCLDQGEVVEIHPTSHCAVEAGFEWTGQVHHVLETCSAVKEEEHFTASGIRLMIEVRNDRLRRLEALLRDTTRGSATLRRL
jgi:uncharacterized YigZ family protein